MPRRLAPTLLMLAVAMLAAVATAAAVEPDEILADRALEARARAISGHLRCLVCQNQSIDDSNAPLARDLRLLVRERLKQGETDTAVRAYIVQRYGEFVLLRPPVSAQTLVLWSAPWLLLGVTGLVLWRRLRTPARVRPDAPPTSLSPDEQARLERILQRDR